VTLVAGVDSSTQSCKVVVVDAGTGAIVRTGKAVHPPGSEVPPAAWWAALGEAITAAGGLDDVAAVSVGGQQHGMVALDSDGEVVRDALLWNDTRSAGAARDLISEVGAAEYAAKTGLVPVASFTATKLRWLRDAEPENAARVAAVALPHDWLTWRLRGYGPVSDSPLGPDLSELTTDRSDASGTGYWSPFTEGYDEDLLVRALGHSAVLPRVLGPGEAAGPAASIVTGPAGGIISGPRDSTGAGGIIVGPGAGDNAGAALGLGARAGDVVVSIGTSGTVFAVTPEPSQDPTGAVAGFADASGLYLPLVATLNAARVLDSIAKLLDVDHAGLAELALKSSPGAGGVVLVPYFEGERTPNLPDAKASLHGLTLASTTRPNLARAAVEGLICGLAAGLDAVVKVGVVPERILLIGGAALNPAVQLAASQIFGVPVVVPQPAEYVALGAAVQAAWALTGERPNWTVSVSDERPSDPHPVIREQYAAAAAE
jgi:xylulokinase